MSSLAVCKDQNGHQKVMSLYDYKIDYNEPLGMGDFATVYRTVKRPENEKGWFSYLLPYLYDNIHRVGKRNLEDTGFCVKVLDAICTQNPFTLFIVEPYVQFSSNKILREKGITTIEFKRSGSFFCYFKTRVNGKTLKDYTFSHDFLCKEEDFNLRKTLVVFLRFINGINLEFNDLNSDNIMYDEKKERWEIIDGSVTKSARNIDLRTNMQYISNDKISNFVIEQLINIAETKEDYSKKIDQKLLRTVHTEFASEKFKQMKSDQKGLLQRRQYHAQKFKRKNDFTTVILVLAVAFVFFWWTIDRKY